MPRIGRPPNERQAVTQPLNTSYRFIPLTRGKIAVVDAEDFDFLSRWRWFAVAPCQNTFYAARHEGRKFVYMHCALLPDCVHVDHRDGDGLNNRRANLRASTHRQNLCNRGKQRNNTSGYKGVIRTNDGKWTAQIHVRTGKQRKMWNLGTFPSADQAACAYDNAARTLHGKFAKLNFPNAPISSS